MVYCQKYYEANREKIRAKYTVRAAQKKRRLLMLDELRAVMSMPSEAATPPSKPSPSTPPKRTQKVSPYVFTIDRTPVTVFF